MQNRKAKAIAASRPDWMPQPMLLGIILGLWTAVTALRFLPHVLPH